ncbi:unnamed protein product [Rotaria sordida]|uniref:Uncharacterized protein n=1 Tax=Rotaria sordida TaxID=392033 RepID=A0A814MZH1_9BILA|nr:unnamed protein product [Rotaria sordida]CAF1086132.1 unnamed protein product [Rotaria sordida]
MFDYHQRTINLILIFIIIIFQVSLCSIRNVNEHYFFEHNRAIGGESLDTSKFVLYIDKNASRYIDIPEAYMKNWINDQKMWRTWSIILAVMCFIFFGTLLFFLIHGFITSTGPFASCTKHINENSSHIKMTSSSSTTTNIPKDYPQIENIHTTQQTFIVGSRQTSTL